jgi:O-antigen/teichoic acid export membrane protein
MAFFTAAGPLLVTAFERHGQREVERLMRSYTRVAILIGLPCIAFVAITASDLVWILTGKYDYVKGSAVGPIIAGGSFLYALAFIANTGHVIAKRTKPIIFAASFGLIINVALNFALIPPFGLKGAAAATPVGMACYLGAAYWSARPHARWDFPLATFARAAVAATAGAFAGNAAAPSGGWRPVAVAVAAGVGLPVYVAVLALLGEPRGTLPFGRRQTLPMEPDRG